MIRFQVAGSDSPAGRAGIYSDAREHSASHTGSTDFQAAVAISFTVRSGIASEKLAETGAFQRENAY